MDKISFRSLLYKDIIRRNKFTPFIIFISFLFSFAMARIFVMVFPNFNLIVQEYHIHHFYYGIAFLFISNWIALVSDSRRLHNIAAVMTGLGLGLVIDEVGLLLTCSSPNMVCDYWYRLTYDIVIWFAGSIFAIIYIGPICRFLKRRFNYLKYIMELKAIFRRKRK